MLLYPVKFELSLFWMSQCGNNNKLALQHGGFCTIRPLAAKGLLHRYIGFRPMGVRGSRDSHTTIHAFGVSRLASSDLQNKTDSIAF